MNDLFKLANHTSFRNGTLLWGQETINLVPSGADHETICRAISTFLYSSWYVYGKAVNNFHSKNPNEDLRPTFDSVFPDIEFWDSGWDFQKKFKDGSASFEKDGLKIFFAPRQWRSGDGGTFEVTLPKAYHNLSPGFYVPNISSNKHGEVFRIYLALTQTGAIEFVRNCKILMDINKGIQVKVSANSNMFNRADAGVIYVPKEYYLEVQDAIYDFIERIKPHLRDEKPAMTFSLGYGISVAESPKNGQSFGQHRCDLIAKALLRKGVKSKEDIIDGMRSVFVDEGIDIKKPYTRKDSIKLLESFQPQKKATTKPRAANKTEVLALRPYDIAHRVTEELSKSAIWSGTSCTWIGSPPTIMGKVLTSHEGTLIAQNLDSSLYTGLTGVAHYLSCYAKKFDNEDALTLTKGALRAALLAIRHDKEAEGYYSGRIGDLCAIVRIAHFIGEDDILQAAITNLKKMPKNPSSNSCADLLSGVAGSLVALISVLKINPDRRLKSLVSSRRKWLIDTSQSISGQRFWRSSVGSKGNWLTGISHGLSGIAYAFAKCMDLFPEFDDGELIGQCLNTEDESWLEKENNWEDLRIFLGEENHPPSVHAWCHGAPGILLARKGIREVLKTKNSNKEELAQAQFENILVRTYLAAGDLSLCHGMSGLAEMFFLLTGEKKFKNKIRKALQGYSEFDSMRLGVAPFSAPSLMLGTTGLGLIDLDLHFENLPHPFSP
ncbi:MAG: hypothetical protein GY777_02785 [Candidatus Brocadiaceae bacterium]|nr:hypothetical protein [Candidatus Brocadiaceae bacterium]